MATMKIEDRIDALEEAVRAISERLGRLITAVDKMADNDIKLALTVKELRKDMNSEINYLKGEE